MKLWLKPASSHETDQASHGGKNSWLRGLGTIMLAENDQFIYLECDPVIEGEEEGDEY